MPRAADLMGRRFGHLTVVGKIGSSHSRGVLWSCRCVCGRFTRVVTECLTSGNTGSCGCQPHRAGNKYARKHGHRPKIAASPTYGSWTSMRTRCRRGYAALDPRWRDFRKFLADMGERPPGTTIGRIKNERGYTKSNCRWETATQQTRNRSRTVRIRIKGRPYFVAEIAAKLGISYSATLKRYRRGKLVF